MPQGRIFAPRVTINPGESSRRSSGYGSSRHARIEAPIVTVVDAAAERPMTTALLRDNNLRNMPKGECLLPRAAAVSAATNSLLVSCLGSDTVVELDPRGTDPSRLERRRWSVPSGPTGIAVDDANHRAVVWSQFDRQLAVINMSAPLTSLGVVVTDAPALKKQRFSKSELAGRKLFHKTDDDRIARDGRACASCHPDGREDALTWSTPVGPRQTIMLAGRLKKTAPFSWLGAHKDVKTHLRVTFERLGGTGLGTGRSARINVGNGKADGISGHAAMDALVNYLHAMPAPNPSDALVDPRDVKLAARGEKLFFAGAQGCASCHAGSRTTDGHGHDMGTKAPGDGKAKFDTPSLRFVGGTAPYFHDGRFATLVDMLMTTNAQMGHTMHLSRDDALALTAYMETL
jgi:mono/diheme cytochrome c family protein